MTTAASRDTELVAFRSHHDVADRRGSDASQPNVQKVAMARHISGADESSPIRGSTNRTEEIDEYRRERGRCDVVCLASSTVGGFDRST